jgi:flagellar FliJ protein
MARKSFSLAGLLRVRHAQQQKAMAELSEANRRIRDVAERRARAERTLTEAVGTKAVITDSATLNAVAAARASTRGMLAELDAVAAEHRAAAAVAQQEYNATRARSIALEKLEARHAVAAAAAELHEEQIALDEIASVAHSREDLQGEQS